MGTVVLLSPPEIHVQGAQLLRCVPLWGCSLHTVVPCDSRREISLKAVSYGFLIGLASVEEEIRLSIVPQSWTNHLPLSPHLSRFLQGKPNVKAKWLLGSQAVKRRGEDVLPEGTGVGIFTGQTPETWQKTSVAESSLKPMYKQLSFQGRGSPGNKLAWSPLVSWLNMAYLFFGALVLQKN